MYVLVASFFLFVGISQARITSTDEGVKSDFVSLQVKPDSKTVQYIEVYLQAPGYIDLSELYFSFIDDGHDPEDALVFEDLSLLGWEDDEEPTTTTEYRPKKTTYMDIAVVFLPEDCPTVADHGTNAEHCDFKEVGIGRNYSPDFGVLDETYWCCTDQEVELGICDGTIASYGRMMMNLTTFDGSRRYVEIPPYGKTSQGLQFGRFDELEHSGRYAVVFSNCHETAGREVVVQGDLQVKSAGQAPDFHVAMKSFAQQSLEKMKELEDLRGGIEDEETRMTSVYQIHIGGITLALITLGFVAVGLLAVEDRIRRLGTRIARNYHRVELSEMELGSPLDEGYVPISTQW